MKDGIRLEGNGMMRDRESTGRNWIWEEPCLVVREQSIVRDPLSRGWAALSRLRAHPTWQILRTLLVGFLFGVIILGLLFFGL